jgi:Fe-S cluster biogenesis protein NfuA
MTSPQTIDTVPTPNPDALMFKVQETLVPVGTYDFRAAAQASDAPLPRRIFDLAGVTGVLVAPRFVTVTKAEDTPWPMLVPLVKDALRDFLDSGDMAVPEEGLPVDAPVDELSRKVVALLDEFIRPAIAQDGGDIVFLGIDDGVVVVRLIGACGTCPSSTATLAMGVERMLLEELPELRGVRQEGT